MKENTNVEPRESMVAEEESYQLPLKDILNRVDVDPEQGLTPDEAAGGSSVSVTTSLRKKPKNPCGRNSCISSRTRWS